MRVDPHHPHCRSLQAEDRTTVRAETAGDQENQAGDDDCLYAIDARCWHAADLACAAHMTCAHG